MVDDFHGATGNGRHHPGLKGPDRNSRRMNGNTQGPG